MRDTVVVNLLGGPGIAKSTNASLVFGKLKTRGVLTEFVHEYAKDLVWENRIEALSFQPYVTVKQIWHLFRLQGKVDIIVTDSPILLGLVYTGKGNTPSFSSYVLESFNLFNNINFFLERNPAAHPYIQDGRQQTEEQAIEKDQQVLAMLERNSIPYTRVPVLPDEETAELIVRKVLDR